MLPMELPSMSSAGGSRARTFHSLASALALKVRDLVCGRSTGGLLASYDPASSSWRTSQACLVSGWEPFSETFPRSGMMQCGTVFLLPPSAHLTGGTGFGSSPTHSIPTPTSQDYIERTCTSTEALNFETNKSVSLDRFVRMWPTPDASVAQLGEGTKTWLERRERVKQTAQNGNGMGMPLTIAVQLWPTATARDYRHPGRSRMERTGSTAGECLPQVVGGALNPTWVEWLMGFPRIGRR